MPSQSLPEPDSIREVMGGLLGTGIGVAHGHPDTLTLSKPIITAVYEREDGKIGGVVVVDLEVAAFSGAALAMIPAEVAKECIEEGQITENLRENFHEVLNVGAQWFAGRGNPHVKLARVFLPGERPTREVAYVMAGAADRIDYDVTVEGYGKARMRFLSTTF